MAEAVLDFGQVYELAVVINFYRKSEEYFVTFKIGSNRSQIIV